VREKRASDALLLTGMSLGAAGVAVAWMAWMAGGLGDLVQIVTGIAGEIAVNPYVIAYGSGPGYWILDGLWIVSPMTFLFAVAGLYASLRRFPELAPHHRSALFIALFTALNVALAIVVPNSLNLRHVARAFGTWCLLGGLGAWYVYTFASRPALRAGSRLLMPASLVFLLLWGWSDYRRFQRIFVRGDTPDLSIRMLRDAGESH
jgi:hypothetical protein